MIWHWVSHGVQYLFKTRMPLRLIRIVIWWVISPAFVQNKNMSLQQEIYLKSHWENWPSHEKCRSKTLTNRGESRKDP